MVVEPGYPFERGQFDGLPQRDRPKMMDIKDRKSYALLCFMHLVSRPGFAGEVPTAWDFSPVGECIENYKIPKPTAEYPMTVQVPKNTDVHKNRYVWFWDPTPGKKPTRQLVRVNQKNSHAPFFSYRFLSFTILS
jgi:hypothetical protein